MNLILFVLALVSFILAAAVGKLGGVEMEPVGLAFLTAGFIFGGWPSWFKAA